ncbi:MAG: hypothetical protein JXB30_19810 [Anaerolineae bacterium]|nr:hypothetical protein [Anaerolineae bacterium]
MSEFNPSPHDRLVIAGQSFQVMPHPSVPAFAFGQEGRKAFVYQISSDDGRMYALKKFKPAFRVPELVDVCDSLARFSAWRGLEVCARECLHAGRHDDALDTFPDLEYAVLMPWISGSTWYDIVVGEKPLTRLDALTFANATAEVLSALEESGLAHCDIAAPNVIINPNTGRTHLIDIEDLYAPGFALPSALPAGTAGYAHKVAADGLWSPTADRFAGAVLLAEMAAWHVPDIRKAADEEHFFGPAEVQQDSARYQLMSETLASMDTRLAELFEQAWISETLDDCPRLTDWRDALYDIFRKEQISQVVSDWQPLTIPGVAPEAEPSQEQQPAAPPAPEPELPAPAVEEKMDAAAPAPTIAEPPPAEPAKPAEVIVPQPSSRPIVVPSTGTPPASAPPPQVRQITPPPAGGPVKEWLPLAIPSAPAAAPSHDVEKPARHQDRRPIPIAQPASPEPSPAEPETHVADMPQEEYPESEVPVLEPEPKEEWPVVGEDESTLLKPVLDLSHVDKRNRPHLVWSESPGATQYLLHESEDPEFASVKEFKLKADDTRWNPIWGRSGRIFYRVQAKSEEEASPWSDVLSIRIA